jgi:hypothetical protein
MTISLDSPAVLLAIPVVVALAIVELSGGITAVFARGTLDRILLGAIAIPLVPFMWLVIVRLVQIATRAGVV